jgi:hypothetical protein
MELTLFYVSNHIREWMERARSKVEPELDEESPETDAPIPSVMVTATANLEIFNVVLDHNLFHNGH